MLVLLVFALINGKLHLNFYYMVIWYDSKLPKMVHGEILALLDKLLEFLNYRIHIFQSHVNQTD
jgi:hypothetical protein